MNIPNFPTPSQPIVQEDGTMHPGWYSAFQQLFIELQKNTSNEGIKMPQQTADNIAQLNTAQSTSAIVYNSDDNEFYANKNGTFKKIVTEP